MSGPEENSLWFALDVGEGTHDEFAAEPGEGPGLWIAAVGLVPSVWPPLRSSPNSHPGIGGPVLCPPSFMQPQPPHCLPGNTCSCQIGSPDHPAAPQPALPSLCLPSLPQGAANACRSQKPKIDGLVLFPGFLLAYFCLCSQTEGPSGQVLG